MSKINIRLGWSQDWMDRRKKSHLLNTGWFSFWLIQSKGEPRKGNEKWDTKKWDTKKWVWTQLVVLLENMVSCEWLNSDMGSPTQDSELNKEKRRFLDSRYWAVHIRLPLLGSQSLAVQFFAVEKVSFLVTAVVAFERSYSDLYVDEQVG